MVPTKSIKKTLYILKEKHSVKYYSENINLFLFQNPDNTEQEILNTKRVLYCIETEAKLIVIVNNIEDN